MALRPQDPFPDWITHVLTVDGRRVIPCSRDSNIPVFENRRTDKGEISAEALNTEGRELVSMKDVNVKYHERHVSI